MVVGGRNVLCKKGKGIVRVEKICPRGNVRIPTGAVALRDVDILLFVCSFVCSSVCRQKLNNLEL